MVATRNRSLKPDPPAGIRAITAKNLNALLDTVGMTPTEFQRRTGFSGQFVGGVLRGEQNISIDNLHVMARALGVQLYQVLNARFDATDKSPLIDMLELSNREVDQLRTRIGKSISEPRRALAAQLRRLLKVNGLSVAALAEDIGIATSTIQKSLKGTQNVTIDNLERIAGALGVAPFVLVLPADE